MKNFIPHLTRSLFLATLITQSSHAGEGTSTSTRTSVSSASATTSGNPSAFTKKSVTVTSDGKNTIRRIVTVRDGIESVVTEKTDENGKITRSHEEPKVATLDPNRPWLGLRVQKVSKVLRDQLDLAGDEGLVVEVLAPNGPAAEAGAVVGDLLLRLGETPVATSEALLKETLGHKIGETVPATIMRKGKRSTINIKLEKRSVGPLSPPDGLAQDFQKSHDGEIELSVENNDRGDALEAILADPGVPEQFKENVRKMQERLRNFEKRHGIK